MRRSYAARFHALGTECSIQIVSDAPAAEAEAWLQDCMSRCSAFEQRFSRFITSSELSHFNNRAGLRVPISREFYTLLAAAQRISIETDGFYNPFVLPALQRSGYTGSWQSGAILLSDPEPKLDYRERVVTSIDKLELHPTWARIPYNTALDLGGCGKGYLGDQLADILDKNTQVHSYWLSLGGDVVARGRHENDEPITIMVPYAHASAHFAAAVATPRKGRIAVATSTTLRRQGTRNGKKWHHIINPATGKPADTDVHTATVCHMSLFAADVHASNIIITGRNGWQAYATAQSLHDVLIQYSTPKSKDAAEGTVMRIGTLLQPTA